MLIKTYKNFTLEIANLSVTFDGHECAAPIISASRLREVIRDFSCCFASHDALEAIEFFSANAEAYFDALKSAALYTDFGRREAAFAIGRDWLLSLSDCATLSADEFLRCSAIVDERTNELSADVADYIAGGYVALFVAYEYATLIVDSNDFGRHVFEVYLLDYVGLSSVLHELAIATH